MNVLSNWGTFVVLAVVNFFLSPFIVHHLGDSLYGIWAIVGSVVGYLGLLDLGVRGAVTRYMARYTVTREIEQANRLASSALILFGAASALALIASVGFAAIAPGFLKVDFAQVTPMRLALLAAGGTIVTALLSGVFGGILAGLHRWTQINGVEIGLEALRVSGILVALNRGGGIVSLAVIQLVLGLLRLAIYAVLSHRVFPKLRMQLAAVDRETIRMILGFGGSSFLLQISTMVILYSDSIVIGALLPVSAVTFFAIAASLTDYARRILSGISQPLAPLASATDAVGDSAGVGILLRRSARLGALIIAPVLVTFLVRGGTFIALWMGEAYREATGNVLRILTIAALFATSHHMLTVIMIGVSRHRRLVPVFIGEAVVNLVLSLLWARPFGVAGVAAATTLPRLVVTAGFGPYFAQREFGISPGLLVKDAWIRPISAVAPFALASFLMERFWQPHTLATYFAQVALALPLALAGAWYVAVDANERVMARGRLAALVKRLSPEQAF